MLRILAATVLLVFASGSLRAQDGESAQEVDPESPYDNVQVLARAMQLIRQDYVDEGKISYRDMTYSALRGMRVAPESIPRDSPGLPD